MENECSKEQLRFLRKIRRLKEYMYSPAEANMVIYLRSKKYVVQYTKPSCKHAYCQITESGKAYLYSRKISNRYHRIPIIISILALIVSALSIVLSPFFQVYFTKLYGLQALQSITPKQRSRRSDFLLKTTMGSLDAAARSSADIPDALSQSF